MFYTHLAQAYALTRSGYYLLLFLISSLIHHYKNTLLSLHIFVHHCTFCASLHVKTSPAIFKYINCRIGLSEYLQDRPINFRVSTLEYRLQNINCEVISSSEYKLQNSNFRIQNIIQKINFRQFLTSYKTTSE